MDTKCKCYNDGCICTVCYNCSTDCEHSDDDCDCLSDCGCECKIYKEDKIIKRRFKKDSHGKINFTIAIPMKKLDEKVSDKDKITIIYKDIGSSNPLYCISDIDLSQKYIIYKKENKDYITNADIIEILCFWKFSPAGDHVYLEGFTQRKNNPEVYDMSLGS